MKVQINPKLVFKVLVYCQLVLLFANLMVLVGRFQFGWSRRGNSWVKMFYFDAENNAPTTFTVLLFLFCAVMLLVIMLAKKQSGQSYFSWGALAVIFLFLGMDELYEIHELLVLPFRSAFVLPTYLFMAWVIPYGIAVLVLGVLYLKLFLNLDKRFKILFFVSGMIYLLGVIGMEMVGAHEAKVHSTGAKSLNFAIFATIEESLEMFGLIFFAYSLQQYILDKSGKLIISSRPNGQPETLEH
jgi:hypothetical protein